MNNNIANRVMSSGYNPVSGLKCVCLNARSIVNKMGELSLMVEDVEDAVLQKHGLRRIWVMQNFL